MQTRSLSEVALSPGMEVPAAHTPKIGRPSGRRSSLPARDAVVGNLGDAFTPSHGARTTWAAACSPSGEASDADEVTMRAPADACGSLACSHGMLSPSTARALGELATAGLALLSHLPDAPRDDLVQALAKGQNPLLQAIMEVEAADNSQAALAPSAAAPMRCPQSKPTARNQNSPSNVELEVHALLQNLDSKLDVGYVSNDSASKILATSQANEIEDSAPDPQSQSKTPRHQGTQRANAVSDLFCVLWVLLSFVVTLLMALLLRLSRVAILLLPPSAKLANAVASSVAASIRTPAWGTVAAPVFVSSVLSCSTLIFVQSLPGRSPNRCPREF